MVISQHVVFHSIAQQDAFVFVAIVCDKENKKYPFKWCRMIIESYSFLTLPLRHKGAFFIDVEERKAVREFAYIAVSYKRT